MRIESFPQFIRNVVDTDLFDFRTMNKEYTETMNKGYTGQKFVIMMIIITVMFLFVMM